MYSGDEEYGDEITSGVDGVISDADIAAFEEAEALDREDEDATDPR